MKSLGSFLHLLGQSFPELGKRLSEMELLKSWESAVGAVIAKHARSHR
jgi:hypothetical protein